jgi:hypothetical protein
MAKVYLMGEAVHEILQNSSDEEHLDAGKENNEENSQFATLRPTKCTLLFFRYLYYNVSYNIPTCFNNHGFITEEPTKAILHKTKLATFVHIRHGVKGVKWLKCSQQLYS